METRWFLVLDGLRVIGHIECANADWASVPPQPSLVRVDEPTFFAVANGSTQNPDGIYTPPTPPVLVKRVTKAAFVGMLTPAEFVAMLGPQTDPMLAWGVGLYQAASDPFPTEDPRVAQLLTYCASTGVLTQARADTIYAALLAASRSYPS